MAETRCSPYPMYRILWRPVLEMSDVHQLGQGLGRSTSSRSPFAAFCGIRILWTSDEQIADS